MKTTDAAVPDFDKLSNAQRKFAAAPRPLVGHVPTIAITPVADGRTGAFEDNVAKTWAMVEKVHNLITSSVNLPDGPPVLGATSVTTRFGPDLASQAAMYFGV